LLEIGDVFIVNKGDRHGADEEVARLRGMLEMGTIPEDGWKPPVLKTIAVKGKGIAELVDGVWSHRRYLMDSGQFKAHNTEQTIRFVRSLVMEMAADKIFKNARDSAAYQTLLGNLNKRKIDPFTAAEKLVKGL
jgi:LAO/AO transport system kinase